MTHHSTILHRTIIPLIALSILFTIFPNNSYSADRRGRLGIGMSSQLQNNLPAISLKIQRSRAMAMGAILGLDTSDNGGYGAGLKLYRVMFEEPQLNFYGSALAVFLNDKTAGVSKAGFQFDFTLGAEFFFTGLSSLGFSFETGFSLNKINNFVIETVGQSFVSAAIHFYL